MKKKKIKLESELIKEAGYKSVKYSKSNDPIILFSVYDRQDNNKFVSKITSALQKLDSEGKKITPKNLSKETMYSLKEIELNFYEIITIMDTLEID